MRDIKNRAWLYERARELRAIIWAMVETPSPQQPRLKKLRERLTEANVSAPNLGLANGIDTLACMAELWAKNGNQMPTPSTIYTGVYPLATQLFAAISGPSDAHRYASEVCTKQQLADEIEADPENVVLISINQAIAMMLGEDGYPESYYRVLPRYSVQIINGGLPSLGKKR